MHGYVLFTYLVAVLLGSWITMQKAYRKEFMEYVRFWN